MTLGFSLKRVATMIAVTFIGTVSLIGCSDDKGGGAPSVPPPAASYRYLNNQCVDQNNTPVAQTYCQNTGTNNGICYDQYNRQIQCTNTGNTGGNNGGCPSGQVYVPGYNPSCLPAGNCGANGQVSVIWNGTCYVL